MRFFSVADRVRTIEIALEIKRFVLVEYTGKSNASGRRYGQDPPKALF